MLSPAIEQLIKGAQGAARDIADLFVAELDRRHAAEARLTEMREALEEIRDGTLGAPSATLGKWVYEKARAALQGGDE